MQFFGLRAKREVKTALAFDRDRRLSATTLIAAVFVVLLSILTIAFLLFSIGSGLLVSQTGAVMLTTMLLFCCIVLYATGAISAKNGKLAAATFSTLAGTNLSIIMTTMFWAFLLHKGLSPVLFALFASFAVAIMLAGIIGESWMVLTTTLVMTGLTLFLVRFAPLPGPTVDADHSIRDLIGQESGLFLLVSIAILWAIAAISVAGARIYRHALGELAIAYEREQQLDTLKDQFIANVNHEIRTPVMTLQAYVEYLRLTRHEMTHDEEEEVIDKTSRATYGLAALLTSILDIQRIDHSADQFAPEPVFLFPALDAALLLIDPHEANVTDRRLRVWIPKGLAVWGEPIRIQQILINLISNAIKYSFPDSPIEIRAQLVADQGKRIIGKARSPAGQAHMVEITIRDYGLGIPPDEIPLLFRRFVRLPRDLASHIKGNGLGLHLCKVLAEAMGGTIWVESSGVAGEGSTFHVRLPAATTHVTGEAQEITLPRLKIFGATQGAP